MSIDKNNPTMKDEEKVNKVDIMKFKVFIILIAVLVVSFLVYDKVFIGKYEEEIELLLKNEITKIEDSENMEINYKKLDIISYKSAIEISDLTIILGNQQKMSVAKLSWKIPFDDAVKILNKEMTIIDEVEVKMQDMKYYDDNGRVLISEVNIDFDGKLPLMFDEIDDTAGEMIIQNNQNIEMEINSMKYQSKNGLMLSAFLGTGFGDMTQIDNAKAEMEWNANKNILKLKKMESISKTTISDFEFEISFIQKDNNSLAMNGLKGGGMFGLKNLKLGDEQGIGALNLESISSNFNFDYENIQSDRTGNGKYELKFKNLQAVAGESMKLYMPDISLQEIEIKSFEALLADDKNSRIDMELESNVLHGKLSGGIDFDDENIEFSQFTNVEINLTDIDPKIRPYLSDYLGLSVDEDIIIRISGTFENPILDYK